LGDWIIPRNCYGKIDTFDPIDCNVTSCAGECCAPETARAVLNHRTADECCMERNDLECGSFYRESDCQALCSCEWVLGRCRLAVTDVDVRSCAGSCGETTESLIVFATASSTAPSVNNVDNDNNNNDNNNNGAVLVAIIVSMIILICVCCLIALVVFTKKLAKYQLKVSVFNLFQLFLMNKLNRKWNKRITKWC